MSSDSDNHTSSKSNGTAPDRRTMLLGSASFAAAALGVKGDTAQAQQAPTAPSVRASGRPNILVIMPDDVGYWNLSTYNRGVMGYRTPNIDRIAREGAVFSDQYAQPSCTPGRASFISGMYPIRSGLTTVGMVGDKQGMQANVPSLAEVLKQQGYATGQFGKNHLGDRNEHLPTVHGFDEFYGFLYHLNVLQEPLDNDYPRAEAFHKSFTPRGIIHSFATDAYDKSVPDERFGEIGKQRIVDTGLPDKKRFETLDTEFNEKAFAFMDKAAADKKPFFIWLNPSRMHVFTYVPDEYKEKAREYTSYDDPHGAGMIQHDGDIGTVLAKLDQMGIADNTIVIYTTDNGPEHSTYPYGGTTPFRSEKMSTWEGGVRVPMLIRWPGRIKAGSELNGIQTLMDVFATLAVAGGVDYEELKQRLMKGDTLGTDTVKKVYLDGVDNTNYWTGKSDKSARDTYIYWADSRYRPFALISGKRISHCETAITARRKSLISPAFTMCARIRLKALTKRRGHSVSFRSTNPGCSIRSSARSATTLKP